MRTLQRHSESLGAARGQRSWRAAGAGLGLLLALLALDRHAYGGERMPMQRTLDAGGFHTVNGERFWSRPLYGANHRSFVTAGELPHAAFMWIQADTKAFVRCGHCLPGIVAPGGTKWLFEAAEVTATYDPGRLHFTVRDPAFAGELAIDLVPLAPDDGYTMRFSATAPVQLVLAFGGFLCLPDKDPYQGTYEFPGGVVAEAFRSGDLALSADGVGLATLAHVADPKGQPLDEGLRVAFLLDRKAEVSLHEATTGIALADLLAHAPGQAPVQVHRVALNPNEALHVAVLVSTPEKLDAQVRELSRDLGGTFDRCQQRVADIAGRVRLETPDTLVDLGARSLSVNLDALWFPPVFLHGPIRWGWPGLCGWRMAYGGDVCGTYDRVASHCRYYGEHRGQGGLDRKPHADPASVLTRQAADSLVFGEGGVVNWGIYNLTEMWLSFIAHHYAWTGDREFLRSLWPAIRDGVAFEKRAMDMDNDSLYENYANTYITDAHWHNGGNCTQASAYMYRGNLLAAEAARLAGADPAPYLAEATRIREAMNRVLWLPQKGVFAEWQDTLGAKLLHPAPELGSVYRPIDDGVADEFQAYQMLRYTEWGLPNHEVEEAGPQPFDGLYRPGSTYAFPQPLRAREVKTSTWRPIILTVHECSPGEQMDLARAYWRLGLSERAFPLVKAVLRCMVNLTTPGALVIRDRNDETWSRSWANNDIDHCDTIGSSLQCLAEGLFGIHPKLDDDLVEIQPGFPADWAQASIHLHDLSYGFRRQGDTDTFTITTARPTAKRLRLVLRGDGATVTVNGQALPAKVVPAVCHPFIEVEAAKGETAEFAVTHGAQPLPVLKYAGVAARGKAFTVACQGGSIAELKDPQGLFAAAEVSGGRFTATVAGGLGFHTAFLRVKGQATEFWLPVDVEVREALDIVDAAVAKDGHSLTLAVRNNAGEACAAQAAVSCAGREAAVPLQLEPGATSAQIVLPLDGASGLVPGQNPVALAVAGTVVAETRVECWDLFKRAPERRASLTFVPVDISAQFNDNLALVHTHEYLSPRSPYCSLQIGSDLFREWCSAQSKPCGELDLGLLKAELGKNAGVLLTEPGIPFRSAVAGRNIVFVSQWDNFPKRVTIPVGQAAQHAYLLMASVTNPMQSGLANGRVTLTLADGTAVVLDLVNPDNLSWCVTNYPNRYGPLCLVQPAVRLGEHVYATLYSLPLPRPQRLESLALEAVTNESVIGLLALTLVAPPAP